MIKFFRRIRQKLLSENKFSKYLLYALGEIILVVIGILIALSINNWNEEKKLFNRETIYLNEIRNNLISDSLQLVRARNTTLEKLELHRNLFPLFSVKTPKNRLLDSISENLPLISNVPDFDFNPTAFENIKASESINIITNDSLRIKLTSYYALDIDRAQEMLKRKNRELLAYVTLKVITKEGMKRELEMETLFKSREDIDLRSDETLFIKLGDVTVNLRNQKAFIDARLKEVNKLIEYLDRELEPRQRS